MTHLSNHISVSLLCENLFEFVKRSDFIVWYIDCDPVILYFVYISVSFLLAQVHTRKHTSYEEHWTNCWSGFWEFELKPNTFGQIFFIFSKHFALDLLFCCCVIFCSLFFTSDIRHSSRVLQWGLRKDANLKSTANFKNENTFYPDEKFLFFTCQTKYEKFSCICSFLFLFVEYTYT